MSYVVLAYPKIAANDYEWVQSIRKQYDPRQYTVVKPHVTIVFPTSKLDKASLITHVRSKVTTLKAFDIKFESSIVVEDDSKTYYHAFLIPSLGYDEITFLHDISYTESLESELRSDIPFIPHLGIGNDDDRNVMEKLAGKINNRGVTISGRINQLTVAEYDGSKVKDLQCIDLAID